MKKKERKESVAQRYLGSSYVKIPRKVLNLVFGREEHDRQLGRLYLAMFALGNFTATTVVVEGKPMDLEKGELWVSMTDLSEFTGIHSSSVWRYLLLLRGKGLIEMESAGNRSRIRVIGYDLFTTPDAPAAAMGEGTGPQASPSADLARRVAEEERRLFGERKQRMDLLNYNS